MRRSFASVKDLFSFSSADQLVEREKKMASLILSWLWIVAYVALSVLFCLYIYYRVHTAPYWSKRNIPHVNPKFLLGSLWKVNLLENFTEALAKLHLDNRKKKVLGFWFFDRPNLMIMDLDLIKRILIADFSNFRDRGMEVDSELDPLAGHLFLMSGKKWRNLRVKLTPTFTSGKMKMMFPTMLKCGEELRQFLKEPADRKEVVEVKDVLARFTTDVISSCAFGIETNSLKNPQSEFRTYGKRVFTPTFRELFTNIIVFVYPKFAKMFRVRMVPKDVTDFFMNVVKNTIEYREKTQTVRNDFLQLLIQLIRAGKIEDVDKTPVDGLEDEEIVQKFSLKEAAAQCFVFFGAGFETSSTALTFALYELALNPDIHARLQSEIDSLLNSSELTYDRIIGSEYLDMFVQETLRKYPPVGNLQRQSLKEYAIPELNATLEKGTLVTVSVTGIHRDPDIYPNPEKFDPERFTSEEKMKRHACAFLPFGEGPRNCIGNRFALMQIKIGLISILRDYSVEVTKTTPIPVKYEVRSFIPTVKGGMNLVFTKRR